VSSKRGNTGLRKGDVKKSTLEDGSKKKGWGRTDLPRERHGSERKKPDLVTSGEGGTDTGCGKKAKTGCM